MSSPQPEPLSPSEALRVPANLPVPGTPTAPAPGPFGELDDPRLLTITEVAAVIRVSRMTVHLLVHAGELASIRVGRSIRVPERGVHDYLRSAGAPPLPEQPA